MQIIKTKKQVEILKKLDCAYKEGKWIQYCWTYSYKQAYIDNLKEQWKLLGQSLLMIILLPLAILQQLYRAIMSIPPYSLVITKKNLK